MADTATPEANHPIAPAIPAMPPMPAQASPLPVQAQPPAVEEEKPAPLPPITDFPVIGGGVNPIIDQYNELIILAIQLYDVEQNEQVNALYNKINQQIMQIDSKLKQDFSYSETVLNACRYAICCLLDEVALEKTWTADSQWRQMPLVQKHFANTLSAHKFYHLLKRLLVNPVKYREALETFYLCLILGFQGNTETGENEVLDRKSMIEKTQEALNYFWQPSQNQLSQHKKHLTPKKYQIEIDLPLWPIYIITLITLVAFYLTLRGLLDADIAVIVEQLGQLGR